jgi:hypothetical protein
MSRRIAQMLFLALFTFCTLAAAQELTVTGLVKVNDNDPMGKAWQPKNVVIWLRPVNPQPMPPLVPNKPLRLTQHNKTFEPHLLVVPVGAVVEFPNRDPFFHNVFSLFEGKKFDLGLYEAGTSRDVVFDRPGVSYIFCNIHAEMSAVVIALDTPYYAISDRRGEIVIPHVPAGYYIMQAWAETALPENLNALTREVALSQGSSSLGRLDVDIGGISTAHKNKYGLDYEPPAPSSPGYQQP